MGKQLLPDTSTPQAPLNVAFLVLKKILRSLFRQNVVKYVFKAELTYACQGHAIDATADVHRDPGSKVLSERDVGFVQAHSKRFRNEYIRRDNDGKVQIDFEVGY